MQTTRNVLVGLFSGLGLIIQIQPYIHPPFAKIPKPSLPLIKAQRATREAAARLSDQEIDLANAQDMLNLDREMLMSTLMDKIEPSIKPNQPYASARREAVARAITEAGVFARPEVPLSSMDPYKNRFCDAIEKYAGLSRTRRANQWANEADEEFINCIVAARDAAQIGEDRQVAESQYDKWRQILERLQDRTRNPLEFITPPTSMAGWGITILGGLLALLGVGFVARWAFNSPAAPSAETLEDLRHCVEAAATGDLSRTLEIHSEGEIGKLAKSFERLLGVLGRSQNMVYHMATLIDSSGEAILSVTLDGILLSWNKGAQRMYGYGLDEVRGHSITFLSPEDSGAEIMEKLRLLQMGERVQPFETVHKARNGRTVRALVRIAPILDSTRQLIGASFCAQDLTDIPQVPQGRSQTTST